MIKPRIKKLKEKNIVGIKSTMSRQNYCVEELWRSFISRKQEITNTISSDLISMTIYPPNYFTNFNTINQFEKWAATEVSNFDCIPRNISTHIISEGLYAIFDYKGTSTDNTIFKYIFEVWLPTSDYLLDKRPHFEILGRKYKNNDINSEEEIYIPIKIKQKQK